MTNELLQISRTKFEPFFHSLLDAHLHVLTQKLFSDPVRVADFHPELHSHGLTDKLGVSFLAIEFVTQKAQKSHQLEMRLNDQVKRT